MGLPGMSQRHRTACRGNHVLGYLPITVLAFVFPPFGLILMIVGAFVLFVSAIIFRGLA